MKTCEKIRAFYLKLYYILHTDIKIKFYKKHKNKNNKNVSNIN